MIPFLCFDVDSMLTLMEVVLKWQKQLQTDHWGGELANSSPLNMSSYKLKIRRAVQAVRVLAVYFQQLRLLKSSVGVLSRSCNQTARAIRPLLALFKSFWICLWQWRGVVIERWQDSQLRCPQCSQTPRDCARGSRNRLQEAVVVSRSSST